MSKRRSINEKPRATVSEIVEQDKIIRQGFEARIGAPLPVPMKSYAEARDAAKTNEQARYVENRIAEFVNLFARSGSKNRFLSQAQREDWWREYEYGRSDFIEEEPTLAQEEDLKWDAYCILIGIPVSSRIGRMFQMLPDDRHPPKEWSIEVVASVTTGKLLCEDLAQFMEFMIWFAGGWPDTFAGELDKNKAHRLLVHCAAQAINLQWQERYLPKGEWPMLPQPDDVRGVTPQNSYITVKGMLLKYPKTVTLRPANFTELMALSGAK